jgi:hypothetical protein
MSETKGLDADHIYRLISESGEDWADKKSAFQALDDLTKTILSDIKGDYLPSSKSRAEAEDCALASKGYKEHLASLSAARRAWLLAEVRYKNLQLLAELRRSEESTRRAEMNIR